MALHSFVTLGSAHRTENYNHFKNCIVDEFCNLMFNTCLNISVVKWCLFWYQQQLTAIQRGKNYIGHLFIIYVYGEKRFPFS
jgi:hypothetical protein